MSKFKQLVAMISIVTILSLGIPVSALADGEMTPDLYLNEIAVNSSSMLTFTVSNIGTENIDPAVYSGVTYVYIDEFSTPAYTLNWADYADQSFLQAGGSSTFEVTKLYGDHEVMVCTDATGVVSEPDENNNCVIRTFYVDLQVTNVYLNSGILSVDVTNNGTGAIDPTTEGYTYIYIDDMDHAAHPYYWVNLANKNFLTPGGTSTITPSGLTGAHSVRACVDAQNIVSESDETNNCFDTTFTPDLYINNISLLDGGPNS